MYSILSMVALDFCCGLRSGIALFVARFGYVWVYAGSISLVGLISVIEAGEIPIRGGGSWTSLKGFIIKTSEECLLMSEQSTSSISSVHRSELG